MTKEQIKKPKPTSKVIQISEVSNGEGCYLTVLCENGSIWEREGYGKNAKWNCVLGTYSCITDYEEDVND